MKLTFKCIVLLFYLSSYGQTNTTTTIKLSIEDSRSNKTYSWGAPDTIVIYKLPEDTIMFKIIPRLYRKFPIKLEKIPISDYKLIFKNNFKQVVIKQVRLAYQDTNIIKLYPDILLNYSQNTLSKLKEKERISISYSSQGCFSSAHLKITITKRYTNLVATLSSHKWYFVNKNGKKSIKHGADSIMQTKTLNQKNIQDFIRFENELNYTSDGGCTTTDSYAIESKYLNIKRIDGRCNWDGFYYLRKSFFGDMR